MSRFSNMALRDRKGLPGSPQDPRSEHTPNAAPKTGSATAANSGRGFSALLWNQAHCPVPEKG